MRPRQSCFYQQLRIGVSVEIDGYNFEVVKDFVYLGSSINTDDISLEMDLGLLLLIDVTLG